MNNKGAVREVDQSAGGEFLSVVGGSEQFFLLDFLFRGQSDERASTILLPLPPIAQQGGGPSTWVHPPNQAVSAGLPETCTRRMSGSTLFHTANAGTTLRRVCIKTPVPYASSQSTLKNALPMARSSGNCYNYRPVPVKALALLAIRFTTT